MSRIFVLGLGPLFEEGAKKFFTGQSLRTMHFVRALQSAGHQVNLITLPAAGDESVPLVFEMEDKQLPDGFKYKAILNSQFELIVPKLKAYLRTTEYDAVVGVNTWPASILAACEPKQPFWADNFGYTMAEGQTQGARAGHDHAHDHFWRQEARAILWADRISTVTERQALATYGELAMLGRLRASTFKEEFVTCVPCAPYDLYSKLERTDSLPAELFQDTSLANLPNNARIVLWSGGFNTWTDVDLLLEALRIFLGTHLHVHFVATGGTIYGHDDVSFEKFKKGTESILPKNRVHLLGWTTMDRVVALHRVAHVGISVDADNMEPRFGARNRLTNMMACGMPVVTTRGTEFAEWIEKKKLGKVVPTGDPKAFARALTQCIDQEEKTFATAQKGREKVLEEFSPEKTLTEFLKWCESPQLASDRKFDKSPTPAQDRALMVFDGRLGKAFFDQASLHRLRRKWFLRPWYFIKSRLKKED